MFATWFFPNKLIFHPGSSDKVGEELLSLGGTKPLICTDQGIVQSGLVTRVTKALKFMGLPYATYDKIVPNPRTDNVEEGVAVYRQQGCDSIIGIGGGSCLDAARAIGLLITNPGVLADYQGQNQVKNPLPPLISIPTTYGTGAEVSVGLLISDEKTKCKMGISSPLLISPVAILDPTLAMSLPIPIAASTGIDALTHAIETYLAANANHISNGLSSQAISIIGENITQAVLDRKPNAVANMLMASSMAGLAFNSAGLGLTHAIAHALGGYYDIPHGLANAIILPHVMEYNLCANPQKYAHIARILGINIQEMTDHDAGLAGIEQVRSLIHQLGLPNRLSGLVPQLENLDQLTRMTINDGNYFANPKSSTKQDVARIILKAFGP